MGRLVGSAPFFKPGPPSEVGKASASLVGFVKRHATGTILDLGGGRGAYSMEMKAAGFDVTLGEIDPECLASAASLGLKVVDTKSTPLDSLRDGFDTVVLLEVLEHVDDPAAFLDAALACARRRLVLTVPCNDDFEELFRAGLTYNHVAVTDHLNQFTSAELSSLLDRTGFRYSLERGDFLFQPAFLHVAIHKLKHDPLGLPVSWLLRAYCKLVPRPPVFPSRIFVVVDKDARG